ncbi:MAG: permease [Acholeplasmataceae bacterium]|nr:permease [Acholeplasmataceae bacterium]
MQIIGNIFSWLNDQLLKMKWLDDSVRWFFGDLLNIDKESMFFESISFFVYDVIKIFILLSVLIFIASYIQSFFSPERTRRILSKHKGVGANTIGALLGTVTPFCSCSSIPIFIGFTKAGLPIGVTFSFLISSPLVDLASIILLASIFNWKVALAYVIVGLIIAIIGGSLISLFKMERYVEDFVMQKTEVPAGQEVEAMEEYQPSRKERATYAINQVKEIIRKVWLYVIIGVGIGAIIHGVIPEEFISKILGNDNIFSVLIATLLGVPMYADIFGTLPIAEALVFKGVGIGTVLAFMMAVTALSLPSMIMIKKVVKPKLLLMFVGTVTIGILIMGYLFNAFSYLLI